MSAAYLIIGLVLLGLAVLDALWTTLWVDGGAGPVSSRLTTWAWRGVLAGAGRHRHRRLTLFGPAALVAIVLVWVLLLWTGWVLIYAADEQALWHTRDHTPADWSGRIYFVAYTLFTMGNGDFTPRGDVWQLVVSLTNGSGMLLVTLAVTYLLSVVSAVVQKRAFADQVTSLGNTAHAWVASGWNGRDCRDLDLMLNTLSSQLSQLTEQYLAYPVLQYYHAAQPSKSPAVALAVFDDALTLLRFGMPAAARPGPAQLESARASVTSFLETLEQAFIRPADSAPPGPDLERLRQAGLPVVAPDAFDQALASLADRRRRLLGLVRNDGWHWPGH